MLGYFFKILDIQNTKTLDGMAQSRQTLATLRTEDQSFKEAQTDLQKLASQAYQPDSFFSRDITLVDEIQTLEALSQKFNLQMEISGVNGTVNSETPAPTQSPIVLVSYGLNLTGSLADVTDFVQTLENLSFVTTVNGLSLSSGDKGQINANLSGDFYLLK